MGGLVGRQTYVTSLDVMTNEYKMSYSYFLSMH